MPTRIILQVGKNDVPTKKPRDQTTENIINIAIKPKRNCDVSKSQASQQEMFNTRRKQLLLIGS